MALLADYAITPGVFDVTSYPTEGECAARLETIREAMLTEGLVRDLRAGAWRGLVRGDARPWHRRGQELVKKMATQGRLLPCDPALPGRPADDRAWCAEAQATDDRRRVAGGEFATEADYTDPFVVELIEEKGWLIWPLIPYSFDTPVTDLTRPAGRSPNSPGDDGVIYGSAAGKLIFVEYVLGQRELAEGVSWPEMPLHNLAIPPIADVHVLHFGRPGALSGRYTVHMYFIPEATYLSWQTEPEQL